METYLYERQEFRRVVQDRIWVQVHLLNSVTQVGDRLLGMGLVIDISAKGMGIALNESIPPGTEVLIEIKSELFSHQLQATVQWTSELPRSHNIALECPSLLTWQVGLRMS